MSGYLFYSKKCKYCYQLMTVMENQGLLNMFNTRCVDEMTDSDFAKLGLRCVPTLVLISNQNGKQNKGIYEKEDAFKWVDSVISNRRQNMIKFAENNRKLIEVNEMKKRIADGLAENCQIEMEGISDSYAYWKDDITQDIDLPQPKMFVPALKSLSMNEDSYNALYGIQTVPYQNGLREDKLSKSDQTKMIGKLENLRKDEDSQLKNIMQQQQINKVMNADTNTIF